jgi:hypothetical protein
MKRTVTAVLRESSSICRNLSHYLDSSINESPAIGFKNEFDLLSGMAINFSYINKQSYTIKFTC